MTLNIHMLTGFEQFSDKTSLPKNNFSGEDFYARNILYIKYKKTKYDLNINFIQTNYGV